MCFEGTRRYCCFRVSTVEYLDEASTWKELKLGVSHKAIKKIIYDALIDGNLEYLHRIPQTSPLELPHLRQTRRTVISALPQLFLLTFS